MEIAAECMDHLAAGIDTTGDALCFLMYQLSLPSSSNIQEKLFRELSRGRDKPLEELQYLDAVIKEGLRCFPVIPMSQPRHVPSGGRDIDGYFVHLGGKRLISSSSLAMAEMRCLLKSVYSRFRTVVAPDMKGRMMLSDQIISSRPLDQSCKLVFRPRDEA